MEVKPGYKQTEVGAVPEDWEINTIQELIDRGAIIGHLDGNHGELYPRSHEFQEYGVPYITANDLNGYKVSFANCKFLSEERARRFRKGVAKNGDVLFAHNATVGPTALLSTELDYVILSTTATYFRCNPERLINTFLLYMLQASWFVRQYRAVMTQSTRNQVPISAQRKLSVILPSAKGEQEAIAETLSDADALIESLEQLLAKKRHFKQGVMQKLLTGEQRLPGFSDAWKPSKIGDLLVYERPDNYIVRSAEYSENAAIPVLTANKSFILGYTDESFGVYVRLPVIVFDDFTTDCKYVDFPFKVKSSAIKLLTVRTCDVGVSLRYVYERMRLIRFPIGDHKRYYISEYQYLVLPFPEEPEQTAIAMVLSDIDSEIAALLAKLTKARQLKQGMLQELLTGRTRLV